MKPIKKLFLLLLTAAIAAAGFTAQESKAVVLYGVQDGNANLVTIDSVTGALTTVGALPSGAPNLVAGLTGTRLGGGTLLFTYANAIAQGGVFQLNPVTAGVIGATALALTNTGGLSYDSTVGSLFAIHNGNPVAAQSGLGGALNLNFVAVNPFFPGALGGDDNGRLAVGWHY
jgi:hypothetical protein